MSELDAEDAKLVVLARGAMGRAEAAEGAAVRELEGRTYAGAPVRLSSLRLTALQAAVAAAISSGATVSRWPSSSAARPTTRGCGRSGNCRRTRRSSLPTARGRRCDGSHVPGP